MKKQDFLDEKIIKIIDQAETADFATSAPSDNKASQTEAKTIYTGLKIAGQWVEFEERQFIDNMLAMMVPTEFTELDQESAKIKYPMEQRPKTILTDPSGTTNILFSHMDEPMTNEDAEFVRDRLFRIMQRVNPGIKPQLTGIEVISEKNVAYMEFSNLAIDGKVYNLMFFLELDGKTLMGSFNCLTKSIKYWKAPAYEMMRSIKILPSKEECKE